MVVPRLAHHLQGNHEADEGGNGGNGCCDSALVAVVGDVCSHALNVFLVFLLEGPHHEAPQSGNTHADPNAERIERTGVGIVSLTRLVGGLVQVEHDGDTRHEEQEEYHPELLDAATAAVGLPQQSDDTHEQRQHVEHVVSLVALAQVIGQQALVAQAGIVDERDARNPVAVGDFAHALEVVLATGKVPHEVAPVHVIQLVIYKEAQVLHHRRLELQLLAAGIAVGVELCGRLDLGALHAQPLDILFLVLIVVDAREQHVLLGAVAVGLLGTQILVTVGLVGGFLHLGGILRRAVLDGGLQGAVAAGLVHDVAVQRAAIEQRGLAILLTAQVLGQGKGVVGRVLVKRGVLRAADQNQCIAAETDENHQDAGHDVGEHAHRDALHVLVEKVDAQGDEQNER